jgi:hypothetical protein
MTRFLFALAAGLAALPAPAQTRDVIDETRRALADVAKDPAAELAEDVEVMRRVLDRAVRAADPGQIRDTFHRGTTAVALLDAIDARRPAGPRFDGMALTGYGAVFALRFNAVGPDAGLPERAGELAETCQKCHLASAVNTAKIVAAGPSANPRREWDAARGELLGLPASAPAEVGLTAADVCYPGRMAEGVIKALEKNGRHLRHLKPDDRVSVSVSNEATGGTAAAFPITSFVPQFVDGKTVQVPVTTFPIFEPLVPPATEVRDDPPAGRSTASPPPRTGGPPAAEYPGFTTAEVNAISVGDLHLRQDNPKQAAEAYKKAVARFGTGAAVVVPAGTNPATFHAIGEAVGRLRRKLAQALIAAGELDDARKWLDAAKAESVTAGDQSPARPPVPARLTITVTKAVLDQADALGPAGFRKKVTVETTGYTVPTPKKP